MQFWTHLRGSRSRACINLRCNFNSIPRGLYYPLLSYQRLSIVTFSELRTLGTFPTRCDSRQSEIRVPATASRDYVPKVPCRDRWLWIRWKQVPPLQRIPDSGSPGWASSPRKRKLAGASWSSAVNSWETRECASKNLEEAEVAVEVVDSRNPRS